jgi:hypothetical protein
VKAARRVLAQRTPGQARWPSVRRAPATAGAGRDRPLPVRAPASPRPDLADHLDGDRSAARTPQPPGAVEHQLVPRGGPWSHPERGRTRNVTVPVRSVSSARTGTRCLPSTRSSSMTRRPRRLARRQRAADGVLLPSLDDVPRRHDRQRGVVLQGMAEVLAGAPRASVPAAATAAPDAARDRNVRSLLPVSPGRRGAGATRGERHGPPPPLLMSASRSVPWT